MEVGRIEEWSVGWEMEVWKDRIVLFFVKQGQSLVFGDSPAFPPNPLAPALRVFRTIGFILGGALLLCRVEKKSFELNLGLTESPLNEPSKTTEQTQ